MKRTISLILLILVIFTAAGQSKKRGKVKRKYRNVEQVSQNLPRVYFRGIVRDADKNPLPGAAVTVQGTRTGAHTNTNGEFFLTNIPTGKLRIEISYLGYKTKTVDFITDAGQNLHNITLDRDNIHLDAITVTSQKREQQLLDVPLAINTIDASFIEENNITELGQFSEYIPGLYIREQGANRPSFVIRGLTSEEVSPSAQPRVSVYFNNVPVNRKSGASLELFDMEQVEVLKGPQNTLFGRGAQIGAVHFISKKPTNTSEGYLTAGIGDFGQKEVRGALNLPVIQDKLFVRAAGIYNFRDGYVENTFGGTLNGKNTVGGRFSVRFLPAFDHKIDLVVNYQNDDTPGIAFINSDFPNTLGETDIFKYNASLEQGENLGTGKELFSTILTYKYYRDELNYWTSITSFRKTSSFARWDGDGTAAPAIDMSEDAGAQQFYQEIRYNFSRDSRLNGSGGASYWREKADETFWFSTNEQSMVHLFNPDNSNFVDPMGQPVLIPIIPYYHPQLDSTIYIPLPSSHEEETFSQATNQSAEAFIDGTYQLSRKLFAVGGIRAIYDRFELANEASFTEGEESVLVNFIPTTGESSYPNLLFKPRDSQTIKKSALSFTWRAGLKYKVNDKANIFASYSRGRRPNILQFTASGEPEKLDAEKVTNYDIGFKTTIANRVFLNTTGFWQKFKDFQRWAWADNTYKAIIIEEAKSYGVEASIKVAILKGLDFFGNYAYLHAQFDSTNTDSEQNYSGKTFSLSPEHSFAVGFNAETNITPNILLFVAPTYSYKTHIYFEDANTEGLEQPAYELLSINAGLELTDPNIILNVYGTNLLDKKFITSAGNTGMLFGVPTSVPGPPRMIGTKLTWKFGFKERPYYKRRR